MAELALTDGPEMKRQTLQPRQVKCCGREERTQQVPLLSWGSQALRALMRGVPSPECSVDT